MIDKANISVFKDVNKIQTFQEPGQILRKIKANLKITDHQHINEQENILNTNKNNLNFDNKNYHDQKQNKDPHSQINVNKTKAKLFIFIQNSQSLQVFSQSSNQFLRNTQKQSFQLQIELQKYKEDLKQLEKQLKNVKQTLQKQRKFFMSQMYSKQLLNQNYQCQIQCLKKQIEKLLKVQFEISQKNIFLTEELDKYKLEEDIKHNNKLCSLASQDLQLNQNKKYQELCQNQILYYNLCEKFDDQQTYQLQNQLQKKLISSIYPFYAKKYRQVLENNLRIKYQKEIQKNQEQVRNLIEFYEVRIKSLTNLRRFQFQSSPKKINQIYIQENYEINQNYCENISTESHHNDYIYQNLKMSLKDQTFRMRQQNSKQTKTGECQSQFTINHFRYPQESQKIILRKNEDDNFCQNSCCQIQTFKNLFNNRQNKQKPHNKQKNDLNPKKQSQIYSLNLKYIPIFFGVGLLTGSLLSSLILKRVYQF